MSAVRENGVIVAIDGPSGAGKSSLTKLLARRLGYIHIDTGAMFRAVALMSKRAGIASDDDAGLAELCRGLEITFVRDGENCRVLANGEDVSREIRSEEIGLLTSAISARKPVREALLIMQRAMGAKGGVILEGRDIGTVVFPDAEVKFFLSASAEERGRRRYLELAARGDQATLEETIAKVIQRDRQDEGREHAPLKQAEDALPIDSTSLSIDQVLTVMENAVRERLVQGDKG
ncbi:(d)CMP kinase [Geomonas sp. Red69]|uniref:Cytidylate kinase n=1 Tax=Geomonas diazotrophica TaxID=2843197 RepID=A0ABX8JL68_9BACT|nr:MULTISPECIES: (d)CMP kinase [Geomonas]MBU5636792.1 (d)CMP kinase [Geomonas diazotrophica]QWV98399.1 (d)CMP kinase [Geomonas nitrogeniifigens]QXE87581.1 (d)CMP kinase [Geomonas nitrogeniifigens]